MIPVVLDPMEARIMLGRLSEERVAQVLTTEQMPWWFLRARHATVAEDEVAGFDFALYTRDVGRILLQVKSSACGAAKFEEHTARHGRLYRIHVVIARPETPLPIVLGRVLYACLVAREEAIAARCVADHPSPYPHLREPAKEAA